MLPARPLNNRTLSYHAARISVPTYDRARLGRGVVHIGVGSFHRSHQAVYFDDVARLGLGDGWAVTGVGLHHRELKEALGPQDGLYTVVARGRDGDQARVVGSLTRYLFAGEDRDQILDALADGNTRVVTLTITAGGYKVDQETGAFRSDDPMIVRDVRRPTEPGSAIGLLVEALDRRRRAGRPPFAVLSCDNMIDNGGIARTAVLSLAAMRDERLARWVSEYGAFPSSMVDRITPSTSVQDRALVERVFGVRDRCPVMTEPFSQWVVEDAFCHGRPPLDEVGVQFVHDVRPYALTKMRLLNASHSAIGYLGTLAGYSRMDEVMSDPLFASFLEQMMDEEIAPLLPRIDIDLRSYCAILRARFRNPAIADRLVRLCRNGSWKVPAYLISSVRDARGRARHHPLLTLAVAGWCRYLRGVDDDGRLIRFDDARAGYLQGLALRGGTDPRPLLSDQATFGALGASPSFAEAIERDLCDLEAAGTRTVMAARVAGNQHRLAG